VLQMPQSGFAGIARRTISAKCASPCDLRDCAKCHVNSSQNLPLPSTRINVQNPRAFYSPMGPASAACTACHTAKETAAHTQLNTSPTLARLSHSEGIFGLRSGKFLLLSTSTLRKSAKTG
jgi:hypothetical protein